MNTVLFVYLLFLGSFLFSIPKFWHLFEDFIFQKLQIANSNSEFNLIDDNIKQILDYADYIDAVICQHEAYLNSKISLVLLADFIAEDPKKMSEAISLKYGLSFKDYINLKRLDYIEAYFFKYNDHYKKYSFDYMSEKSGFGTRKSLYLAIRKLKNCTPLEYFKR